MDKEDVVHVYNGIYSAIKRSKIGSFVETWMHLETYRVKYVRKRKTNIVY